MSFQLQRYDQVLKFPTDFGGCLLSSPPTPDLISDQNMLFFDTCVQPVSKLNTCSQTWPAVKYRDYPFSDLASGLTP